MESEQRSAILTPEKSELYVMYYITGHGDETESEKVDIDEAPKMWYYRRGVRRRSPFLCNSLPNAFMLV